MTSPAEHKEGGAIAPDRAPKNQSKLFCCLHASVLAAAALILGASQIKAIISPGYHIVRSDGQKVPPSLDNLKEMYEEGGTLQLNKEE